MSEDVAFLQRSLDDLDREFAAGDLAEADYRELRARYEARLAQGELPPPPPRSKRWMAWTALVVAVALGSGLLVARTAGERLPGQPGAGNITPTGASDDLAEARAHIGRGNAVEAIKVYDRIIAVDPRNAEALTYRGWLVALAGRSAGDAGLVDKGLEFVDRAIEADPRYPDARVFKGLILYQDKNDPAGAVPEFRAFLGLDPPRDMVPMVEDVLRRALEATGQPAG